MNIKLLLILKNTKNYTISYVLYSKAISNKYNTHNTLYIYVLCCKMYIILLFIINTHVRYVHIS